jgi:hypothetical protein
VRLSYTLQTLTFYPVDTTGGVPTLDEFIAANIKPTGWEDIDHDPPVKVFQPIEADVGPISGAASLFLGKFGEETEVTPENIDLFGFGDEGLENFDFDSFMHPDEGSTTYQGVSSYNESLENEDDEVNELLKEWTTVLR